MSTTRSSPSPKRPRVEPAGAAARPENYIVFLGGVSQKATPAAIEQALWRRVRGFAGAIELILKPGSGMAIFIGAGAYAAARQSFGERLGA